MLNEIWFEEINFVDEKISNFIYGAKDKNTDEELYFRCEKSSEFEDEEFKGVVLVFGDKTASQ